MVLKSIIRSAPPSKGGPFYLTTDQDGTTVNVTLALASLSAALDQAKADQGALLSGETVLQVQVVTTASP